MSQGFDKKRPRQTSRDTQEREHQRKPTIRRPHARRVAPAGASALQRRPSGAASASGDAAPAAVKSASEWTNDPAMDAAHRPWLAAAAAKPPGAAGTGGQSIEQRGGGKIARSFGGDLPPVRIHEDGAAERAGALAYAEGQEIHAAAGAMDLSTTQGRFLLGHELAHVVQQSAGGGAQPQAKSAGASDGAALSDGGLEAEADRIGARAAAGLSVEGLVQGRVSGGPSVQRYEAPEHEDLGNAGPEMKVTLKNGMTRHLWADVGAAGGLLRQP